MGATLIAAPFWTKNEKRARDPEVPQTKTGNPWHFGLKAHLEADRDNELMHGIVVTAAQDLFLPPFLLRNRNPVSS